MGAALLCQPARQRQQSRDGGIEAAHFGLRSAVRNQPHAGHHTVLMYIRAALRGKRTSIAPSSSIVAEAGHPQFRV